MPKLLDYIKEKGLSHEDVIKLIEKGLDKSETEDEEIEEPDVEEGETDKPEDSDVEVEEETEQSSDDDKEVKVFSTVKGSPKVKVIFPNERETEEEQQIDDKEAEFAKKVKEEVKKQILRIKRKTPSKGTKKKTASIEYGISDRGYEELV